MGQKYWEIIIEKSRRKRTIPFIIGSKKFHYDNSNYDNVEKLFDEIINSENDISYTMQHCNEIGEYVIYKNYSNSYLLEGLKVYNPKSNMLKLVFAMNMSLLGNNFDEIVFRLSTRYKKSIEDEKFSFIDREFEKYSENDKKEIKSYFQK